MGKLLKKRLLLSLISIPVLCWGPGLYVPGEWVAKAASFIIFLFGALSLWQRRVAFYEVVWLERRDLIEQKSHYGIVGDVLIALGLIYSGIYGYWWLQAGQPDGWAGTMYSSFGRILIGFGLGFNFLMAQSAGPRGAAIEGKGWIWASIILAFVCGMLVMANMKVEGDPFVWPVNTPACPKSEPYWISSNDRIHGPSSPYRYMIVRPKKCFSTEADAIKAGYLLLGSKPGLDFEMPSAPNIQPSPTLPDTE